MIERQVDFVMPALAETDVADMPAAVPTRYNADLECELGRDGLGRPCVRFLVPGR